MGYNTDGPVPFPGGGVGWPVVNREMTDETFPRRGLDAQLWLLRQLLRLHLRTEVTKFFLYRTIRQWGRVNLPPSFSLSHCLPFFPPSDGEKYKIEHAPCACLPSHPSTSFACLFFSRKKCVNVRSPLMHLPHGLIFCCFCSPFLRHDSGMALSSFNIQK